MLLSSDDEDLLLDGDRLKKKIYRLCIELTNGRFTSFLLRKFVQSSISKPFIKLYASAYRINQEEMLEQLQTYENLHHFFIRKLKQTERPIDSRAQSVISPVDALIEDWGIITSERQMFVKGKPYFICELLGSQRKSEQYKGGTYIVLYLSPAHYHRIHSPVNGEVVSTYSLGRKSYPVNRLGLKYGKAPLAKNYRTVVELAHDQTRTTMVMVGAMWINSIVITNEKRQWTKGDEIAYFSFGSTVVLLFKKGAFSINKQLTTPCEIRMGELLGTVDVKK